MAWRVVVELDERQQLVSGTAADLRNAIRNGADLRIYSEFYHDEHIDPESSRHELIQESMDMRVTYLVDDRWSAGVISLRQPVQLPDQFGPRPSLSLFLYNEDGRQAIARPILDGAPDIGLPGPSSRVDYPRMPKYHEFDRFDDATNAPSSNFVYAFERLRYFVCEDWREVLHHGDDGKVLGGSLAALAAEFRRGAEFKVGIRGLCDDLLPAGMDAMPHEVFVQLGSCYLYTEQEQFVGGTHPLVRIRPAIPLAYSSRGWDYGWLIVRSDGHVALLIYDPYTLQSKRLFQRHELRWFCR